MEVLLEIGRGCDILVAVPEGLRFLPVRVNRTDKSLGLHFHLIREGQKPARSRRCRVCKTLLTTEKKELCLEHGNYGFRQATDKP